MRAIIILGYLESSVRSSVDLLDSDYVICADRGYDYALAAGISPNLIVGDLDSVKSSIPENIETIATTPEKDDTDAMLALNEAILRGYSKGIFIGGLGGRIDHTLGMLAVVSSALDRGATYEIRDGETRLIMTDEPQIEIERRDNHYFSLLTYNDVSTGIYIHNAKYPLTDYTLTKSKPIGVSNEFTNKNALITKKSGRIVIIVSEKDN